MALTERYVSALAGGSGNGLTEGTPFTFAQAWADATSGGGPGRRYNVKADGTYTRTADDSTAINGSNINHIVWRGYGTTPGDGYQGRTGDNGPLVTTNMPLISYNTNFRLKVGDYWIFESLRINCDVGNLCPEMGLGCALLGCAVTNVNNAEFSRVKGGNGNNLFNNDLACTSTSLGSGTTHCVLDINGEGTVVDSNRILSSASGRVGVLIKHKCALFGNLIKGAGGSSGIKGQSTDNVCFIRNNTIVNWSKAIELTSTAGLNFICGNMVTDCAAYGVDMSAGSTYVARNRFRDLATAILNGGGNTADAFGFPGGYVTTDTGGPETDYVDASTNNYKLIDASPGIESNILKPADMGFAQREKGTGGGSQRYHPLGSFIIRKATAA